MIAVTGATGQLGHYVIEGLLAKKDARQVAVVVRNAAKAQEFAAKGVQVRLGDYNDVAALTKAFQGVESVLLISSNEIGKRYEQHRNVINAARAAGVGRILYTSLLHADSSPLNLAPEHVETEKALKGSGIPYVILRNGWYTENYTGSIPSALANGAFVGSAKDGRISSAPRKDYAAAAVAALLSKEVNRTYELAGDDSYTLKDLAAEISRQSGKNIPYVDMEESAYAAILVKAGLPEFLAKAIASWDAGASIGGLYDASHELSRLIGRPTTPLKEVVKAALK